MANLRCGAILILAHVLFANPLFKMEFMLYVECVILLYAPSRRLSATMSRMM